MRFPANSTSLTIGVRVAGGNGHGAGLTQLNNPVSDLRTDANGNLYISDYSNDRIVRWLPNAISGEVVAGGNGYGSELNKASRPTGLHLDSKGDIYVTQRDHGRMLKFSIELKVVTIM
jgi:streptogramin lyase